MIFGIPAPLVTAGGGVPAVCARHGEPATQRKRVVFRSPTPLWTYPLLVLGLLPFVIVARVLQKIVKAPSWPFCPRCERLRYVRLATGLGSVLLGVAGVLVLAAVLPPDASYAGVIVLLFVLVLIVGLGVASMASRGAVARGLVSSDGTTVGVRDPHPRFAEESAAAQRWALAPRPGPGGPGAPPPAQYGTFAPQPGPVPPQPPPY